MKILEVINIGYEAGGAEKSVKLIKDELPARGHEVSVLATDTNAKGKAVFADELLPAISGSAPTRLFYYFWYPTAYRTMRRTIQTFQPDIIHLHTIGEFSPSVLWALGKTPALLTVHGPEEYTLKQLPWALPPSCYTDQSYQWKDITLSGRARYLYLRFLQRPAYRLALRRVRLILAPSKFMAGDIASDFPASKLRQLYNGIPLPDPIKQPEDGQTVLYVGRLTSVKGVDCLLRSFTAVHEALPGARLRIVGDGDRLPYLKTIAQDLGLDTCVEFPGWINQADIFQEYAAASVLAIPSVWPENLPTVAIEALAIGRPIIGSNVGGIPELVEPEKSGYLVNPSDEPALANAIIATLQNRDKLHRMSAYARETSGTFSDTSFINQLLEIYEGLAQS